MIDALLERGVLEIRDDDARARPHGADLDSMGLPSTLEQLLADRIQELPGPGARHRRLARDRGRSARPRRSREAQCLRAASRASDPSARRGGARHRVTRLCARGLCDRKGDVLDFRHPLTRDVAYAALDTTTRSRMHRALGQHLAETSLARGVSAAIVARHLVKGDAPERAAHFYQEAANAARNAYQTQLADPLLPARRAVPAVGRSAAAGASTRRSRRSSACSGASASACAISRSARDREVDRDAARGVPRAPPHRALRPRRRPPRARAPGREEGREPSRTRAQYPSFEIEAELLVSELSRELGDVQGALAASDRALAACNPTVQSRRPGARARRRPSHARRPPPPRRSRARGGRRLRRGDRRVPQGRRAAAGSAREERARLRDVRAGALRRRDRARARVDPHRPLDRRPLPAREDAHQHRPLVRAPRRHAARAGLPEARARGARALRRSGRSRRHAARLRGGPARARRRRRRGGLLQRGCRSSSQATGNAYDITHAAVVGAALARYRARRAAARSRTPSTRAGRPSIRRSSRTTSTRSRSKPPRASTPARCTRPRFSPRPRSAPSRRSRAANTASRSASSAPTRSSERRLLRRPGRTQKRRRLRCGARRYDCTIRDSSAALRSAALTS